MDLDLAVLKPGDEITYKTHGHVGVKCWVVRTGVVMTVSSGRKTCVVINLGQYRDTIYDHDLKSGDIKILEIKKGEDEVLKKSRPDKEYLQALFEKAGGNIKRAAAQCEPPVSDVTMGKWLRDAGIIPQTGLRSTTPPPPVDELRAAWEEAGHVMTRLAKKYGVSTGLAKRWLKMMGIVRETATGLETIPAPDNPTAALSSSQDDNNEINEVNEQPAAATSTEERENEALRKIIKFYLAPIEARLDSIEEVVNTLRDKTIKEFAVTTDATIASDDLVNTIAELIVQTAARIAGGAVKI